MVNIASASRVSSKKPGVQNAAVECRVVDLDGGTDGSADRQSLIVIYDRRPTLKSAPARLSR